MRKVMFGAEISEWVSTIKKGKPASKYSAIGDRCNRSIYCPAHLSGSGLNTLRAGLRYIRILISA